MYELKDNDEQVGPKPEYELAFSLFLQKEYTQALEHLAIHLNVNADDALALTLSEEIRAAMATGENASVKSGAPDSDPYSPAGASPLAVPDQSQTTVILSRRHAGTLVMQEK